MHTYPLVCSRYIRAFILFLLVPSKIFSAATTVLTKPTLDAKTVACHIQVLQELKNRMAAKQPAAGATKPKKATVAKPKQTATQAYLKLKKGIVASHWKNETAECKEVIDAVLRREAEFSEQYHVFYHGQRGAFRLLQDFLQRLYGFLSLNCPQDFHFLRAWFEAPVTIESNKFIDKEEKGEPCKSWYDHEPHLVKGMLCANVSLFGNSSNAGECTFSYFYHNYNINDINIRPLLQDIFKKFGFNTLYLDKLCSLQPLTQPELGSLLQIFVPTKSVDKFAYMAHAFGTPLRTAIDPTCFSAKLQRHTKISPLLEAYRAKPNVIEKTKDIDMLQARILFSQDGILSPQSGVKIFRYTKQPLIHETAYERQLNELCADLFGQWIAKQTTAKLLKHNIVHKQPLEQLLKRINATIKMA